MSQEKAAKGGKQDKRPLTTKELKKIYAKKFGEEYETYYPVDVLRELGFQRFECAECGHHFWSANETDLNPETERRVCGDSTCTKSYGFISNPPFKAGVAGPPKAGERYTMSDIWKNFKAKMESSKVTLTNPSDNNAVIKEGHGHTAIKRYPVVARWRKDVDFVIAGIFCFQPHVVSGELEPPANPLVCPQFCLRFGDLDNIGYTGRHYSGFHMLGMQVFNNLNEHVYFKEETVRFNLDWLTGEDGLRMDMGRIKLIEDCWAGGGNLGPCVEYFVDGLEVGNMVFMEFRVDDDSELIPLERTVVDVGIGLERLPWLLNGAATSYQDTFPAAFKELTTRVGLDTAGPGFLASMAAWEKFAPFSCNLNMDEVDDPVEAWAGVVQAINETNTDPATAGYTVEGIRDAISGVRDLYVILDHTRTLLFALHDGCIPSNQGGGSNLRRVARVAFRTLQKNGWHRVAGEDVTVDLIWAIMQAHVADLKPIHTDPQDLAIDERSFRGIIGAEYAKMCDTDAKAKDGDPDVKTALQGLKKALKGSTPADAVLQFFVDLIVQKGVMVDRIEQTLAAPGMSKLIPKGPDGAPLDMAVPGHLNSALNDAMELKRMREARADRKNALYNFPEAIAVQADAMLEGAAADETQADLIRSFEAVVVTAVPSLNAAHPGQAVVLDKTFCYPTSGGQKSDTGTMTIDGTTVAVDTVEKDGRTIVHYIAATPAVTAGQNVQVTINWGRRQQLRAHHTAAHILHAAAHEVLGAHVWQQGAEKAEHAARLDISHFAPLTFDEKQEVQARANQIIAQAWPIEKYTLAKETAEARHGYSLYQGGIVPGNTVRIVHIGGADQVDVEACCGTHCSNTAEVGAVYITNTTQIRDGQQRLEFVAGPAAVAYVGKLQRIVEDTNAIIKADAIERLPKGVDEVFRKKNKGTANLTLLRDNILAVAPLLVMDAPEVKLVAVQTADEMHNKFNNIPKELYTALVGPDPRGLLLLGPNTKERASCGFLQGFVNTAARDLMCGYSVTARDGTAKPFYDAAIMADKKARGVVWPGHQIVKLEGCGPKGVKVDKKAPAVWKVSVHSDFNYLTNMLKNIAPTGAEPVAFTVYKK